MKKFNYSKCLLWVFVVGSILSCTRDTVITKVEVTFNYNYKDAPSVAPQTANIGSKINTPKTPTRSGYTFKGWNTKAAGTGTNFNFETTTITGDITLYAQWEIITYTVTFNYNYTGATPAVATQTANSGSKINTPTNPKRSGYTLKGWNTNADGTDTDFNFETTPITGDLTLYAKWIQAFTVTFNYNYTGAPATTSQPANSGSKINTPTPPPTRSDYMFKGWNTNATGTGTPFDFETTPITGDITLYAQWQPNSQGATTYTVIFNYNYKDAPSVAPQPANSGSKINTPTSPTRSGYALKAWNSKADGTGTDFNFETTPITENITLYAQWELITYTVTFNYNYTGGPATTTHPINSGSKINIPTSPKRSGYTLKGWNTNATGTGTDFNFETTTITENITLYAQWIQTFTVTFNYNYTGATPAVVPQTINSGSKINTPTPTPTRSGYTLKGWNTNAAGTGTDFNFETSTITENITLYAQWEIVTYTVSFNYNYTGAPATTSQPANSGSKINAPDPTRSGYTFRGWNTKADGTGEVFIFSVTPIRSNQTLYAKWQVTSEGTTTYTVTFNYNYTGAPTPVPQTTNSGSKINAPTTPNRSGYTLKGWNTIATGTGADFNFKTTPITTNITLYAQWEIITYTVSFNYNYTGAPATTSQPANSGSKINAPTPAPTRSEHTFKGWNTIASGTGTNFSFQTTPITGDLTLYAQWEIVTYTVTFNYNYTEVPAATTQPANSGSKINKLTPPNRPGYTLKGWNTNASGTGTDFNFETTPITGDLTLYAQWEIITYTVTFNYNYTGATPAVVPKTVNSGSKINTPTPPPTRSDHTFKGWNTNASGTGTAFNFETTPITENLTLYAQWEIITYIVSFNYNYTGATPAVVPKTVNSGSKINTPTPPPTRFQHTFKGWNTNASGTGTDFNFETTPITENITLYAKWQPNSQGATTYTVSFNYNYTGATPAVVPKIVNSGSKINTPTPPPTRSGYTFGGWNPNAAGAGTNFNFETTPITGDVTLYAQWLYYPLNKSALQDLLFTQNVNPTKIDTGRITDMSELFKDKTTFNGDISGWDTSKVTNMSNMFANATIFNSDISTWNTSKVTRMGSMFAEASKFNGDVSKWNTSKVTTMDNMFLGASAFNQDISTWNTSSAIFMTSMFYNASKFNGDVSTWNTSKVTTMQSMFFGASAFNQDLSTWNTSKVTRMGSMFAEASKFNGDVSKWNTSKVTTMDNMFLGASAFNQDISTWNTSNVTTMFAMFQFAKAFNGNISKWNTSEVTDMSYMFSGASVFNGDISKWNTSSVTDMSRMFQLTSAFNGDISTWNTSKVTNMQSMFSGASAFNGDLSTWNTSEVINMSSMFYKATAFNQDLSRWDTSKVSRWSIMFRFSPMYSRRCQWPVAFRPAGTTGCLIKYIVTFNYNYAITPDKVLVTTGEKVKTPKAPARSDYTFRGWNTKADGTGTSFDFEATTITADITLYAQWEIITYTVTFNYNYTGAPTPVPQSVESSQKVNKIADPEGYKVTSWHRKADGTDTEFNFQTTTITENITLYAQGLYYPLNKSALQNLLFTQNVDPTKIYTGRITDMSELFKDKITFNKDISGWDTSKVTTMEAMFQNASAFNQDLSTWNTSSVTNMYSMFYKNSAFNGNISRWNTSKVTTMGVMFAETTIFNSDISGWNTSKVTNVNSMFYKASAFNQNLSKWDMSIATNMLGMFGEAPIFNSDISGWNTSSATNMDVMFYKASAFNQDLSAWNTSKVTSHEDIFKASLMADKTCQWPPAFRPAGTTGCVIKYIVTFNYNYATTPDKKILVATGEKTKTPTAPTRSGYAIKAWNSKADGTGSTFNFETTTITANITLYAQWVQTFTVSFNYNYTGATPAVVPQTANSGSKIKPPTIPTRSGYTIKTWNSNAGGTGTDFNFQTTPITENITLYAKWIQIFTVTFNYNYIGAPTPVPQSVEIGQKANKIATPESYKVTSWHRKADGTDTEFNFETTTITENITLYAQGLYYPLNKSALQALLFTQNVDPTKIDTGRITDMSKLFKDKTTFNGDLSKWNTSKVTNMDSMFHNASVFNGNLSNWDTSEVSDMGAMFYNAPAFNGDLSKWNTSEVTNMSTMFSGASIFNSDISGWNTSNVIYMSSMFHNASAFNQDISKWDTSKVSYSLFMFFNASAFNQDISTWNTSNAVYMESMFESASAFNQDLSAWNTSKVKTKDNIFKASLMADKTCQWPPAFRPAGTTGCVIKYIVTFNYNYATTPDKKILVATGEKTKTPTAPTRSGYAIKAWNSKADGTGSTFNFETTTITANITLYAQWVQTFTVSFNYNYTGATPAVVPQTANSGSKIKPPTIPTRSGYTIKTWNSNAGGTGTDFNFQTTPITENITLYAKWIQIFTVTFNYNYIGAPTPVPQSVEIGQKANKIATPESYKVTSWHRKADGTDTEFNFETTTITENITLYAQGLYYPLNKSALQALLFTQNVDPTKIDTGRITDMSKLFKDKTTFNGDLSKWNTSKVTNMDSMFHNASVFNGNLSNWDTSEVSDMGAMFYNAPAFNGDLSKWNTSEVTNMSAMFSGASIFNSDISKWDISKVTTTGSMFHNASAFNQDISKWDTSKVSYSLFMFFNASAFNQDISTWNTSNAVYMESMFESASAFNQDLSAWNTSKVKTKDNIFKASLMADKTCQWPPAFRPAGTTGCVIKYIVTFNYNYATTPNKKILVTTGEKVKMPIAPTRSDYTFKGWNTKADGTGTAFNFETTTITESTTLYTQWEIITYTVTFNYNYTGATPAAVKQKVPIGQKTKALTTTPTRSGYIFKAWNTKADGSGSDFNFQTTTITEDITLYAKWLYYPLNKSALQDLLFTQNVDPTKIDTGRITDMSYLFKDKTTFNGDISGWDTSKVTNMRAMFLNTHAFNGDLSKWNTSKVTNMYSMFQESRAFNQNLSKWNTSSVTTMSFMFENAHAFNGDLSKWNTSKVTDMSNMFYGASVLNGDISKWNTSSVTNMEFMFFFTTAFNGDISKWNTSEVTNMSDMFSRTSAFNGNISGWNTSKVTVMSYMFSNTTAFNQDLSGWNTSKVTTMDFMFLNAKAFNQDISRWNTSSVTSREDIFKESLMVDKTCQWPVAFRPSGTSCP